jgi:hypothetical protein
LIPDIFLLRGECAREKSQAKDKPENIFDNIIFTKKTDTAVA